MHFILGYINHSFFFSSSGLKAKGAKTVFPEMFKLEYL